MLQKACVPPVCGAQAFLFYNAKDPTAEIHTHDAKQLCYIYLSLELIGIPLDIRFIAAVLHWRCLPLGV